ncbi:MAG: GNAT family N-acetyltransferase [Pseudomonadota bacterium]
MKSIFEANQHLGKHDPTFTTYPLDEYQALMDRDGLQGDAGPNSQFFLRKISTASGRVIGYFQLEIHTPKDNVAWIPMLVLHPEDQRNGYGQEVAASVFHLLEKSKVISHIRLNVYAENLKAFEFWYRNGFSEIVWWSKENIDDRQFSCLVLSKELSRA